MNYRRGLTIFGRCAITCAIALLLSSCSGFFPSKDTIVSMSISPGGAYVVPNGVQQFTATATFGDNSTGDVTSSVTWTSSAPTIATVDASGLALGVALGSTTITAKSSNNVTATATLTVSNKTITAISIAPQNATISLATGQTQQFSATATFSDGTFADVTTQVTWSSSNIGIATISTSGLATPVAQGSVTIGASLDGVAGTASLTVQ